MIGSNTVGMAMRRTLASLGGQIDRLAIRILTERPPRSTRAREARRAHYEEMAARYEAIDPARFYAPPPRLARVRRKVVRRLNDGLVSDLSWASEFEPHLAEARPIFSGVRSNATVHARLYEHARPAPGMACLHGYRGGYFRVDELAWRAEHLWRCGFNVALMILPFHGVRGPLGLRRAMFPDQADILITNEGFAQSIWDLRRLLGWLRAHGGGEVGVAGMSLGGYVTSLLATIDESLAFAIPVIPLADITDAVVAHEAQRGVAIDAALQAASRRALAIHSPLLRTPLQDRQRMRILAAEFDRVTGRRDATNLAAHFGADVEWFPTSHMLALGDEQWVLALARFAAAQVPSLAAMAQSS